MVHESVDVLRFLSGVDGVSRLFTRLHNDS